MKDFNSAEVATSLNGLLGKKTEVSVPPRLLEWLLDLRCLRHVPLAYLVPDPALLPPESIRFFHVDRTWADRLVDGAMSAGNIGTVDMTFTAATLKAVRQMLDEKLGFTATTPITGMIIRSELVERWPDMIIQVVPAGAASILRRDVLSRSILVVLFAGTPTDLRIREPDIGLRFGAMYNAQKNSYEFTRRDSKGKAEKTPGTIFMAGRRVINLDEGPTRLKTQLPDGGIPGDPTRSRDVAINLRLRPYEAVFRSSATAKGSEVPSASAKTLIGGKEVAVASLLTRSARRIVEGGK